MALISELVCFPFLPTPFILLRVMLMEETIGTPTMDFQFGRTGRKATEGTFLPTDALVAKGQQDALNPNIITNRICDQLTK
jgi:hypothetical protein